jgi:predicted SAM-dependent methyltransferase
VILHPRRWLEPHWLDALDTVRTEWAAVKGRWISPPQVSTLGREYLQLGSGDSHFPGFLNSCWFLNHAAEAHVDIRFPLRFAADTWRGIYAHHVVEHVSYPDALKLFTECHRTLRDRGVFRMVVPDVERFIRLYADPNPRERQAIFSLYPSHVMETLDATTPLQMLDYIFRDHKFNRHLSAWDWDTALACLKKAGFGKVVRQAVNISIDPMMAGNDKPHWAEFSLYVEGVK